MKETQIVKVEISDELFYSDVYDEHDSGMMKNPEPLITKQTGISDFKITKAKKFETSDGLWFEFTIETDDGK